MPTQDKQPDTMIAAGHTWTRTIAGGWSTQAGTLYIHLTQRTKPQNPHARPAGWYVTCPSVGVVTHHLFVDVADPAPLACRYAVEYLREMLNEKLDELKGDPKLHH